MVLKLFSAGQTGHSIPGKRNLPGHVGAKEIRLATTQEIGQILGRCETSSGKVSLAREAEHHVGDFNLQELAKQGLKIKGQEFVLDAQLKVLKEQIQRLKTTENLALDRKYLSI